MAQEFTFTIEISADGATVTGTVNGIKGKGCGNVQKLLDRIGEELEHEHTPEWDAPEPVRIATGTTTGLTIGR